MARNILLMGDGHGAIAAYRGLAQRFDDIALVTDDDDLAQLAGRSVRRYTCLDDFDGDAVVLAGCRTVLGPEALERCPVFNVHYSLLPRYRGLHSVVWAMLNDEQEIGLTVHRVTEEIDAGDIVHQFAQPIDDSLTSADLMRSFNAHVAERLGDVIHDALTGKITPRVQDHREATWVARRDADDCLIDFTRSNRYLSRFFRALVDPYPLPQIVCAKGRYEIASHRLVQRDYEGGEGRVVHIDGEGGWIKVREGLLIVHELRATDGSLHAAGRVLKRGERLA